MKPNGWVDLQVNGYAGVDFNAPGLTEEAVNGDLFGSSALDEIKIKTKTGIGPNIKNNDQTAK